MDRPYQVNAIRQLREMVSQGKRRIVAVAPTGSGKMHITARLMQLAIDKGFQCGFIAHQRELVEQCMRHLASFGVPCHVEMAGFTSDRHSAEEWKAKKDCWVASKDTVWARAFRSKKKEPLPADLIVFDEAHLSLSRTWMAIADHYEDAVLVGFTATPCRGDGRGLGNLYQALIQVATYEELQASNFLVPLRIWAPSRPDLKKVKLSGADYSLTDLEKRLNKRTLIGDVIGNWTQHVQGRSTVVFASGVKHSIHLRDEFRRAGADAEHVDGMTPLEQRQEIFKAASSGDVEVVCNFGVVTTGVDVPRFKYMICCRPTKSFGLWRQMAGRIQRPFPGYSYAIIQDHSDCALRHGYPDEDVDWILDTNEVAYKERSKRKNQANPYICPKCKAVYRGAECPACGHRRVLKGKGLVMKDGKLYKVPRQPGTAKNRHASHLEKQRYWDECLGWAIGTGRPVKSACGRYKSYFGVWPNHSLANTPRTKPEYHMLAKEFYQLYRTRG